MKQLRRVFVKDLLVELVKNKPENISVEIIMSFVEDILWYLENDEEEDCKMNQYLVGMQELFWGFVVIVWEEADLNSKKYSVLNKIVIKKCREFYVKCWKDRNKIFHSKNKQRICMKEWYEKEKLRAENSNKNQVRLYVKTFKININLYKIDTMKR